MDSFSERLKKCMDEKGISEAQLAEKIGLPLNYVNNYCTGKTKPKVRALVSICIVLNMKSDFLLGLVDEEL